MAKNIDVSLTLAVYSLHKTGFAFVFHEFLHVPRPKSIKAILLKGSSISKPLK